MNTYPYKLMESRLIAESFFTNETLEGLTERHPVKAVFGSWHTLLRNPDFHNPHYGAAVFWGSPANNREAEILFGELVKEAAEQDRWVGKRIIPSADLSDLLIGVEAAEAKDLLTVKTSDEMYDVAPTNNLIRYVTSKIRALSPDPYPNALSQLTRREYEVLRAATIFGYENATLHTSKVSKVLGIEVITAKNHINNLLSKLNAKNLPSAISLFLQNGNVPVEDVIGENLGELQRNYDMLTRSEKGVLSAFAACALQGDASAERVGERLLISPYTVRNHIQNIYSKLGISKRNQLAIVAYWHMGKMGK